MKKFKLLSLAVALLSIFTAKAQVTVEPVPLQEDSQDVTVYFHADQGTQGLMGVDQSTAVYAHTGVNVVDADGKTEEWKYAPTWLENSEKYQLTYVSENLWKLYIGDIRTYYGVAPEETVKKLCFVFRNANGSKEGKAEGGQDIFVDVMDSGFQLDLSSSISGPIILTSREYTFTATSTDACDMKISVNGSVIGTGTGTKELKATYTFVDRGDYTVKAEATLNGKTISRTMPFVFAPDSQADADTTVPEMGVTKNADGSYTFCLCAPDKENVILVGSWNNYVPTTAQVMNYVDQTIEGGDFRFFKVTVPASVTGKEFGYYYYVDSRYRVGDPYARLVLDPYNDKYISEEVYPNMPAYPVEHVNGSVMIAWYSDNLLNYKWNVDKFQGADKENLVIYELLFRDFTGTEGKAEGNGTVNLAIEKIPYLKQLGVNVIELLPINEFNGNNSWGYNPNFYFAVDKAYGTPQDYKRFIDLCHENGIAVVLDVVFNQSDGLHPWYQMYRIAQNPFYNRTAPHAYSVLNDWNQGNPMVQRQWEDMLKFWLKEYKVDGFRFDLVKGLGDNDSYLNATDNATNAYNASRVARMKKLHDAMREVNPDAYFINENLAGAQEENEMAKDGELNWMNLNNNGCQYAMGYSSGASLVSMIASKAGRTAGSTVAYLESHDEERMAYKQDQWGVAGVKGDNAVSMQRIGSAAAQMILSPGSHMIWMFSEMGNAQSTKDATGGNNTSPKIVNWNLLEDPDNKGLMENYSELINLRLTNQDLFRSDLNYNVNFGSWAPGRYYNATNGDKEIYLYLNPNVTGNITFENVPFVSSSNSAYQIGSKSYGSNPSFDAAAKTITVEPNCYVVIATPAALSGVENVSLEEESAVAVYGGEGVIRVANADADVMVYSIDGAAVANVKAAPSVSVTVPAGIYVVRAGAKTVKVLVK